MQTVAHLDILFLLLQERIDFQSTVSPLKTKHTISKNRRLIFQEMCLHFFTLSQLTVIFKENPQKCFDENKVFVSYVKIDLPYKHFLPQKR